MKEQVTSLDSIDAETLETKLIKPGLFTRLKGFLKKLCMKKGQMPVPELKELEKRINQLETRVKKLEKATDVSKIADKLYRLQIKKLKDQTLTNLFL